MHSFKAILFSIRGFDSLRVGDRKRVVGGESPLSVNASIRSNSLGAINAEALFFLGGGLAGRHGVGEKPLSLTNSPLETVQVNNLNIGVLGELEGDLGMGGAEYA